MRLRDAHEPVFSFQSVNVRTARSIGSTIQYFIVPQGGISLAARATLRTNKTMIKSHKTVIYLSLDVARII